MREPVGLELGDEIENLIEAHHPERPVGTGVRPHDDRQCRAQVRRARANVASPLESK